MEALGKTPLAGLFGNAFSHGMMIVPPGSGGGSDSSKEVVRILFLDVDGVLNNTKVHVVYGTLCYGLGETTDGKFVRDAHAVDPLAVGLINALCKTAEAKIVVSSSWRVGYNLEEVKQVLSELGIDPQYIIGKTDVLGPDRGNEIDRFLGAMKTKTGRERLVQQELLDEVWAVPATLEVESYVIIDDCDDIAENQKANFVQTTFEEGLTLAQTIRAGQILTNDDTFYINRLCGRPSAGDPWVQ